MTATLLLPPGRLDILAAFQLGDSRTLVIEIGLQATDRMGASCLMVYTAQPAAHAKRGGRDQRQADQCKNSNSGNHRLGHAITLLVDLLAGWTQYTNVGMTRYKL